MNTLSEAAGVFNTPSENGADLFTLESDTTRLGNREHVITTKAYPFALALFEETLNIDIEPGFSTCKGSFVVEFIATDADCQEAIQLALTKGVKA
ncbi:hypothetical protein EON83_11135 [bacterium]|nr:MAG: hypothetical protein EON83_11135 [bacterium]